MGEGRGLQQRGIQRRGLQQRGIQQRGIQQREGEEKEGVLLELEGFSRRPLSRAAVPSRCPKPLSQPLSQSCVLGLSNPGRGTKRMACRGCSQSPKRVAPQTRVVIVIVIVIVDRERLTLGGACAGDGTERQGAMERLFRGRPQGRQGQGVLGRGRGLAVPQRLLEGTAIPARVPLLARPRLTACARVSDRRAGVSGPPLG